MLESKIVAYSIVLNAGAEILLQPPFQLIIWKIRIS